MLKTQGDECQGQGAVSLQGIFRLNPPEGSQAQRELGERKRLGQVNAGDNVCVCVFFITQIILE